MISLRYTWIDKRLANKSTAIQNEYVKVMSAHIALYISRGMAINSF